MHAPIKAKAYSLVISTLLLIVYYYLRFKSERCEIILFP